MKNPHYITWHTFDGIVMREEFPAQLELRRRLRRPYYPAELGKSATFKAAPCERIYELKEILELPGMFSGELSGHLAPIYSAHYYEQE